MPDILGLNSARIPAINTPPDAADPPPALSRRERRVEEIGLSVDNLNLGFERVFPNKWKVREDKHGNRVEVKDKYGKRIPVSNLDFLTLIPGTLAMEIKDDKTTLIIECAIRNTSKGTVHQAEIAIYRATVKDAWNPSMKGKVYCDCEAFQYNLAYPNHNTKNLRNYNVTQSRVKGSVSRAAATYADPGPSRIRKNEPALCKHLAKLWRHILATGGLSRLNEAS